MHEPPPPELDDTEDVAAVWGKLENGETELEFARQLWRSYVVPRSAAIRSSGGNGCWGTD